MAKKPLKSITFPGLPDTYTIEGFNDEIKQALLQIASKVAYIDEDGQDYYDDLYDALYPSASIVSISAVYTQSGTVYDTDSLDSLKSDLVVTATYSDSSTETVPSTDYTLSGTLAVGTSTITVSYGGETTTFNVTVSSDWDYSWYASSGVAPSFMNYSAISFSENNEYASIIGTTNVNIFALNDVGDMKMEVRAAFPSEDYQNNPQFVVRKDSRGGFKVFPAANNAGVVNTNISGSNAALNITRTDFVTYRMKIQDGVCTLEYGTNEQSMTQLTGAGQSNSIYYTVTGISNPTQADREIKLMYFKYKKM